jgi:hypothetical protein
MNALRIEWDENKNRANRHKHGISFEEAETVFADDHALLIADPDHSDNEDRFILLGISSSLRIMVVCHCYRVQDDTLGAQGNPCWTERVHQEVENMRKEYDFSKAKRNPYAKRLKKQVTIRLDEMTIQYFKDLSDESGIPYQTLINLYLRDCAANGRRLSFNWKPAA